MTQEDFDALFTAAESGELAFPAQLAPHISTSDLGVCVLLNRERGKKLRCTLKIPAYQKSPALIQTLANCREILERAFQVYREHLWLQEMQKHIERENT